MGRKNLIEGVYGQVRKLALTATCFVSVPCVELAAQDLDYTALSREVVGRMQLRPGERVLLIGAPGRFNPLIDGIRREVVAMTGEYLGVIAVAGDAPQGWRTAFTQEAVGLSRSQLARHFGDVDVAVMLPGATPENMPYAAMQDVLRSGQSRTIHFHWAGAYDLNGNLLPITPIIDGVYERAVLDTDYQALAEAQRRFEAALRDNVVRVTTREGTDLSFRVGDRPITKQDGDASAARAAQARNLIDREIELPAGAVRVAPLESTVQGTIVFPDARWNDSAVRGLTMHFVNGRLVDLSAESEIEAVESELDAAGPAGRSFREFALGFNPLIPLQARGGGSWIPYYGYGAGIVRLSLGDNTELGGNVGGGYVRWNFFPDATVIVGSEVWVREGRMIK